MGGDDRGDPGVRAAARLRGVRTRHVAGRTLATLALGVCGIAAAVSGEALTGDPGANVGGVLFGILFFALAWASAPWEWSEREQRHHELESIWREVRSDADGQVPWPRFAAWAEPDDQVVRLQLVRCAPTSARVAGAPSPFSRRSVGRLDPDDADAAAAEMERLRERAAGDELAARERHRAGLAQAEERRHVERMAAIDRAAAEEAAAREEAMRQELAAQEAAERRAQADAVARAIRRS